MAEAFYRNLHTGAALPDVNIRKYICENQLNSHTLLVNNKHLYHNKSNIVYACSCNSVKGTLTRTIRGTGIESHEINML